MKKVLSDSSKNQNLISCFTLVLVSPCLISFFSGKRSLKVPIFWRRYQPCCCCWLTGWLACWQISKNRRPNRARGAGNFNHEINYLGSCLAVPESIQRHHPLSRNKCTLLPFELWVFVGGYVYNKKMYSKDRCSTFTLVGFNLEGY